MLFGLPERVLPLLYEAAIGLWVRNATYRVAPEQSEEPITEQTASRDFQCLVGAGLLVPTGKSAGDPTLAGRT